MKSHEFAILIPAYNEEKNIEEAVRRSKKISKHVIVVDDGSNDRTSFLAKKAGAKTIIHAKNNGKGEALNTGVSAIKNKFDFVAVLDADMQYPPEEIRKVMKPLFGGKADFVMGRRDFSKIPFRHMLGNFVWRSLFNILFGTSLKDTNCGLFGMDKEAMHSMKNMHGGYIIESYILSEMLKNSMRIMQVPVKVRYKRISSVPRGVKMVSGVLWFIMTEGLRYRFSR